MEKVVMRHLKQLAQAPLAGACAAPLEDNLREIHCTVVGPAGTAYAGVQLHFVLELSSEYPVKQPDAYFVTDITYHGGAANKDSKGRTAVCLNLFGNFAQYHTEWASSSEGWSTGYSLETVLVQMQSVMHDTFLSTAAHDVAATRKSAKGLKCSCGHTDETPFPPIPEAEEATAEGRRADADVPVCYASAALLSEEGCILGIGVGVEGRSLTTPAEMISLEAFESGVRASSDNSRRFEHFLPLSFCAAHHQRVKEEKKALTRCVKGLCEALQQEDLKREAFPVALMKVCALLMTSMVVEVNKAASSVASDRFIDSYYRVLHTLRCVDADAKGSISRAAAGMVRQFAGGATSKAETPNLGVLLAVLPLSGFGWKDVREPLVAESSARNVFWVVEGPRDAPGPHRELADPTHGSAEERCRKMFASTPVSRKLVCFQKAFVEAAAGQSSEECEARYGCVDEAAKQKIKGAHEAVAAMAGWDEHYEYLGLGWKESGTAFHGRRLVQALQKSKEQGYHARPRGGKGGKGGKGGSKGGKGRK